MRISTVLNVAMPLLYLNISHRLKCGEDKHKSKAQQQHVHKFNIHFDDRIFFLFT